MRKGNPGRVPALSGTFANGVNAIFPSALSPTAAGTGLRRGPNESPHQLFGMEIPAACSLTTPTLSLSKMSLVRASSAEITPARIPIRFWEMKLLSARTAVPSNASAL